MEEFAKYIPWVRDLTLTGALVFILVGGYRKWWVWGYQLSDLDARWKERFDECKQEKTEWKEIALPAMRVAGGRLTPRRTE